MDADEIVSESRAIAYRDKSVCSVTINTISSCKQAQRGEAADLSSFKAVCKTSPFWLSRFSGVCFTKQV